MGKSRKLVFKHSSLQGSYFLVWRFQLPSSDRVSMTNSWFWERPASWTVLSSFVSSSNSFGEQQYQILVSTSSGISYSFLIVFSTCPASSNKQHISLTIIRKKVYCTFPSDICLKKGLVSIFIRLLERK